ncbi:hypothetical protein AHAS_Ahas17G0060700 [Arachis hypogaea]
MPFCTLIGVDLFHLRSADYFSLDGAISRWKFTVSRQYSYFLDKTTPHVLCR